MNSIKALVTGGGRGIGESIVKRLASDGAQVMIADAGLGITGEAEDKDIARKLSEELNSKGYNTYYYNERLLDYNSVKKLVDYCENSMGGVNVLVNNAAILRDRMVFKLDPESFNIVIENNLQMHFYIIRLISERMKADGWGRIINMVSSAGLIGNIGQSAYGSSKGGLIALSRIAALDLAQYGVTVNAIAPFAHTRVTEIIPETTPWLVDYKRTIINRAHAESVADLVSYLLGESSKIITGQVFGVRDGELFLFSQPRPIGIHVIKEGEKVNTFYQRAFRDWETDGLFSPLETDLMYMSKPLKESKQEGE